MGKHQPGDIRNVCLIGHGDAGKTALADAILFKAGAVSRLGSVKDKTSVFDHDDLEREKQHTIDASMARFEHEGKLINLWDTPGYPDYIGDAVSAIAAADTSIVCVNALSGIQVNTRRVWDLAGQMGKARMIVVTKCDLHDTDFDGTLAALREAFGERCIPVTLPEGFSETFSGTTQFLKTKGEGTARGAEFYEEAVERAIEIDDEIMNRYLEGETISREVMNSCVLRSIGAGSFFPVLFTSAEKGIGINDVLRMIVEILPSAEVGAKELLYDNASGEGEGTPVSEVGEAFYGRVVKVMIDKHVGKTGLVRVYSGAIKSGDIFHNASGAKKEKTGHIVAPVGKDMKTLDAATVGEIVAFPKIDSLSVGDTISSEDKVRAFAPIPFPKPMAQIAVRPASRADETKIGEALHKLSDEIPTFNVHRDPITHEMIASGLSGLQLDTAFRRLKDRYHIDVETSPARIPYREAITNAAEGHYRHKKQTGGRGQFGEVFLKVIPCEPGTGLKMDWDIVGGSVPSNFAPAIEKGIREKMTFGVIAGYPILDVHVSVHDGKFHAVDSSEAAFKIAGGRAFADAVKKARPVLLEPICNVEISVPSSHMGDVSGDLNTRRGRIQGMDAVGNFQIIKASVPRAEIADYPRVLTSLTSGEGSFTYEEAGYEQVPPNVQSDIVASFKPSDEDD